MVTLTVRARECVGCSLCVLACSFAHTRTFSELASRVRVFRNVTEYYELPLVCVQCVAKPCLEACPIGALKFEEGSGIVVVNREKCMRCGKCATACPFGGIHEGREGYPLICDLCGGDPQCVKFCPTGALAEVDLDEKKKLEEENRVLAYVWGGRVG